MANKLKNLKITKVDFVDAGANPRAFVRIFKRAPDEEKPEKKDSFILDMVQKIADKLGVSKVEKDAKTFSEVKSQADECIKAREIESMTNMFGDSMLSILYDDETSNKKDKFLQTLEEFSTFVRNSIDAWSATDSVQVQKTVEDEGSEPVEPEVIEPVLPKEEELNMAVDKSKMTPAELAFFEDIEKRYAVNADEPAATNEPADPVVTETKKSVSELLKEVAPELSDIFADVQKRLNAQAEAEMIQIAKKYEILGKKAEELAPVLKRLRNSNEEAYGEVISMLDKTLEIAEQSNLFVEVGTSGTIQKRNSNSKVENEVAEIRKASPDLTYAQALDRVFQNNPALIADYDK